MNQPVLLPSSSWTFLADPFPHVTKAPVSNAVYPSCLEEQYHDEQCSDSQKMSRTCFWCANDSLLFLPTLRERPVPLRDLLFGIRDNWRISIMKLCYKQASGVAFKFVPTYMYFCIFHFVAAPSIGVKIGVEKQEYVWLFIVTLAVYFISSLHVIGLPRVRWLDSWVRQSPEGHRAAIFVSDNQYMVSGLPRYCISWESLHRFKCFFFLIPRA